MCNETVDLFIPKLRWRQNKLKHWFSYDTIYLIREKHCMKLKKKHSAKLLSEHKQLRNKVRYITRMDTRTYSESLSKHYFFNPRKFWSRINLYKCRRHPIAIPPVIDDFDKASLFNQSVFTVEDTSDLDI